MSVLPFDIKAYGSAEMPDNDTPQNIGGAIAKTKKVQFADLSAADNLEIVSDTTDTTQTITLYGRSISGATQNKAETLTGTTPKAFTTITSWERILKAVKSATCAGTVACRRVTPERTGQSLQSGALNSTASEGAFVILDSGANGTDDYYNGMILDVNGAGELREIIDYIGSSKKAYVNEDFGSVPGTVAFEIHEGVLFDKAPTEIMEVRRMFYDASANPSGGATKNYYEKIFFSNEHATIDLTNAALNEIAGGIAAKVDFGVGSALNDTVDNGANNRQVAPGGISFASTEVSFGASNDGNLTATNAHGVWFRLQLAGGDAATNSFETPEVTGQST